VSVPGTGVAVGVAVGVGLGVGDGVRLGDGVGVGVVGGDVGDDPVELPPPCPEAAIAINPAPPRTPKMSPVFGPALAGGATAAVGTFVVHCAVAKPAGGVKGASGCGKPIDGGAGTTTACVPIAFPVASYSVKYTVVALVIGGVKITTGVNSGDPGDGTSEHEPISVLSGVAVTGLEPWPTGGVVGGAVGAGAAGAASAVPKDMMNATVVNAPASRTQENMP
jgi:hypothetical protein